MMYYHSRLLLGPGISSTKSLIDTLGISPDILASPSGMSVFMSPRTLGLSSAQVLVSKDDSALLRKIRVEFAMNLGVHLGANVSRLNVHLLFTKHHTPSTNSTPK